MTAPDNNKAAAETKPADGKSITGQPEAEAAAQQSQREAAAAAQAAADARAAEEKAAADKADAEARAKAAEDKAKAAAKAAKSTVTLKQLRVTIRRDEQTVVPAYVFEHELPVLHAMHGEDHVKVIETDTVEYAGFNAANELERLKRKYRDRDGTTRSVTAVYRSPAEVASAAGVRYSGESAVKPKRSQATKPKKRVIRNG